MHRYPLATRPHCAAVFLHLHFYKLVFGHLFGEAVFQSTGENTLNFKEEDDKPTVQR